MNEILDIRRFWRYFVVDFKDNVSKYGLSLILTSLMGTIFYILWGVMSLSFGRWDGAGLGSRAFLFGLACIVLVITMPAKCYGNIADKRKGSTFLMFPVSTTEKYLSMILNTAVIFPVAFMAISLGLDGLTCLLDSTAGSPLIKEPGEFGSLFRIVFRFSEPEELSSASAIFLQYEYIVVMALVFLLGSITFKRSNTVKTILIVVAAIIILVFLHVLLPMAGAFDNLSYGFLRGLDIIFEIILLLGMLAAVFFRLRTIKY